MKIKIGVAINAVGTCGISQFSVDGSEKYLLIDAHADLARYDDRPMAVADYIIEVDLPLPQALTVKLDTPIIPVAEPVGSVAGVT